LLVLSCGGSSDDPLNTQDLPIFPPIVFIADKDSGGVDELYASFDDGTEIVKLSNALVAGGDVVAFEISPNGVYVAYVADEETNDVFELFVVPVDKVTSENAVKVSGLLMAGSGIKEIAAGEYAFAWAPDSSRVAYLADQSTVNVIELYTNLPEGSSNINVSGELAFDREVEEFSWAPNSSRIGYTAKQVGIDILNLFSALPGVTRSSTQISNGLTPGQVVQSFKWSPNND